MSTNYIIVIIWPRTRPSTGFEVLKHGLLPGLETFAMHVSASSTMIVIARHLDWLSEIIQTDGGEPSKTFTTGHAALGHSDGVVLDGLVHVYYRLLHADQIVEVPPRSHESSRQVSTFTTQASVNNLSPSLYCTGRVLNSGKANDNDLYRNQDSIKFIRRL